MSLCASSAVHAEPVHLAVGNAQGQGYTFVLRNVCYAYTAGHVLGQLGARVRLTDLDSFEAAGQVVAIDKQHDLGLVKLDPAGNRASSSVCKGAPPSLVQAEALLSQARSGGPNAWIDVVLSTSGGLGRFELSLTEQSINGDRLAFAPSSVLRRAVGDHLPQAGDSGASVYGTVHDTQRRRYGQNSEPVARHSGLLLGAHVGVQDGRSVVVRSEVLHEFVYQTLQPVDWSRIRYAPANMSLVRFRRGPFPSEARDALMTLNDTALDHASFELDLGEEDFSLTEVVVETAGVRQALSLAGRPAAMRVSTSQYRPGEIDKARWQRGDCEVADKRAVRGKAVDAGTLRCVLKTRRNTRGLRVEVLGNPGAVKRIVAVAASATP